MFRSLVKPFENLDRRVKVAMVSTGITSFGTQMTSRYDQVYATDLGANPVDIGALNSLGSTRFHWGSKRIVPVRSTSLRISEETFDQNLNPVRARIELCMRVLRHSDLKQGSLGYNACRSHINQKNSLDLLYESSLDLDLISPLTS